MLLLSVRHPEQNENLMEPAAYEHGDMVSGPRDTRIRDLEILRLATISAALATANRRTAFFSYLLKH